MYNDKTMSFLWKYFGTDKFKSNISNNQIGFYFVITKISCDLEERNLRSCIRCRNIINMSGESGRPAKSVQGQRVKPEPVHEKSFVENVVPQTYNNPAHYEGKERITWAWVIPANGEALEVFSWRKGPVRTLKILVTPNISDSLVDPFSLKRPILAICDAAGPGPKFHTVSFISLKTGDQVKTIKFYSPVQDIYSNKNVVVVSFPEKLAIFEATSFNEMFSISTCYRCPGLSINPIALGDQWLAFADRRLYSIHQSCGGVVPEGSSSYKSTVIYAAKSITKGLKELGETVASNFMGPKVSSSQPQAPAQSSSTPGVVTIIDTQRVNGREVNLGGGSCPGLIAHFVAHLNVPIVALEFDASGMLLATADKLGHNFNVFRIQPHPLSSAQAAIHHLYTLYRGDTTAKVMDISFSLDSRWIAISTHRGTTHVYPITPYGGSIGMRTHKSVCVVNRFQRSAGLDDAPSSGRNSPVLSTSPGVSKLAFEPSPNLAYQNPRYPPYPSPVTIKPLAQLRQPLLQNLIESIAPAPSPSHSPPSNKSSKVSCPEQIVKVASIFGATRGWLAGSPTVPREIKRHSVDSLFVMAYHGNLIEYYLEPKPISSLPQEKITEDSPIALEVHASAQWSLVRESTSYEIGPPLLSSNPLLLPREKSRPRSESPAQSRQKENSEDKWMAQVEIYTHAGPPRRLWMGPQFTFKSLPGTGHLAAGSHSPRLTDRLSMESDPLDPDNVMTRLRSDLADAMLDTPQISSGSHKRDSVLYIRYQINPECKKHCYRNLL
ncbi:Breast carcinoma-amplified sequence 3-like protein [Armadillidium nasatum]|uniref:Breast carcinoma-amplified sequence 3-like protein n=1 Tax=Armadillidium nasatum TaxID=96803 RepID=A0A5N5TLB4_9CRUS|nr:Breast carcinoma-amplified sequence 3-like protein [Armadillidium nasatum]